MIISHKYKFIFIKTAKTAGTSIEVFLSQICDKNDIITPICPHIDPHQPRNYKGFINPLTEIYNNRGRYSIITLKNFFLKQKFYNHIPAILIKKRIPENIWNHYYKFCVERNPWDKTLSHFYMINARSGGRISLDNYFKKKVFCLNCPLYTDKNNKLLVDKILKYESLDKELDEVFKKLGVPYSGSLEIQAKSNYRKNHTSYQNIFTESQRKIIEKAFTKEIKLLNYTY